MTSLSWAGRRASGYAEGSGLVGAAGGHARLPPLSTRSTSWPVARSRQSGYRSWYSRGMSVQMTVRVPDDLAKYVDDHVASGDASSRAEMIARGLDELMRREERERETALVDQLNAQGQSLYPDLDGLAEWGANQPMGVE